jgi:hypothetical protein
MLSPPLVVQAATILTEVIQHIVVHVEGDDTPAALPRIPCVNLGLERPHLELAMDERLCQQQEI